jgi:predicted lysophospholipase L1 biosynthesis ABC-type transport system permease subunit
MGRLRLIARLAGRDLRRRPAEAALLLLAITAASTTLTLGLILHDVPRDPYQRTREATAGPDIVATVWPGPGPANAAALEALADAPGVVAHSGPNPVTGMVLEARGQRATAQVEGRDPGEAAVDQPKLTQGSWVEDGGVVIEAAFADALGVRAGDRITLNDRSFPVVGVALTAAVPPYPKLASNPPSNWVQYCQLPSPSLCDQFAAGTDGWTPELDAELDAELRRVDDEHPGMVWLTQADVRSLVRAETLNYVLKIELDDPASAPAFVDAQLASWPSPGPSEASAPALVSWQEIRGQLAADLERNEQRVLLIGSRLLVLLAIASVAVLVGGRMADQTRRVGLLKAVGGSVRLVAGVLLTEYVVVALLAAAAGLAVGWLVAPLLVDPGVGLLGSPGPPAITLSSVGQVTAMAVGAAVAATIVPYFRAARTSTVRALADSARAARRTAWLISLSARLPVPLLLGLRVAARRPRRLVLGVVSIAITVTGVVGALAAHADARAAEDRGSSIGNTKGDQILFVITGMLVALAVVNTIVITWASALDSRHSSAVARALGATSQQVRAALSAAQLIPAVVGAILGMAGGLALVAAVRGDAAVSPPLGQLLAVVPVTVLVVSALSSVAGHLGTRRTIADVLQAELA